MKTLFHFSILALIWSIYYLAMHKTGGILTTTDIVVCGAVIVFCVIMIIVYLCKFRNKKKYADSNLTKECDCMKKKIVIAVVVVVVLVATAFAIHFVNFSNDIPDKELVYLQLQLDGKDEKFVLSQFKGCTREELVQDWGNPDGMLSGFYGDIWVMTENENIIDYYSADSIVEHIKLEQNEQNK